MGVLLILAALGAGVLLTLFVQHRMSARRARQLDALVRRAADANPRQGLGL
jgi:uncharacterized protein HemX